MYEDKDIAVTMAKMMARMQAPLIRPRNERGQLLPRGSRNRYIRADALVVEPLGKDGEAELWVCRSPLWEEAERLRVFLAWHHLPQVSELLDAAALNGYVAFPKRLAPRVGRGYDNLVQYIPVHGGVTYAQKDSFAAVWGFDTLHSTSAKVDRTSPDYIRYQCHVLYAGLKACEELWPRFRRCQDPAKRLAMAEAVRAVDPATSEDIGFNALFNALGGRIG